MSFAMIVYLVGALGAMDMVFGFLITASIVVSALCGIITLATIEDRDEHQHIKVRGMCVRSAKIAVFLMVFSILIPTKETAYTMIAASGVETIVTDERVKEIGGQSLDVIEAWLDEIAPNKSTE